MPSLAHVTLHLFLQLAIILGVYRLLWPVFRRLRQVQVMAVIVAGFVLGPSLLGAVAPDVQEWLFPQTVVVGGQPATHPSLVALYVVGQLGLVVYMFQVGMAFDMTIFVKHIRHAAVISVAGIAAPMVLGGLVGWALVDRDGWFPPMVTDWQGALFVAAAVAITAFPILAWIVHESGLMRTRLGTMALACAAADDAAAWILLAAVVASTQQRASVAVIAAVGGLGYLAVMLTAGRRLLRRLGEWADKQQRPGHAPPSGALVIALLVLLVGAWFTDLVGVYSVFGSFVVGVVMPRGTLTTVLRERLEPLTSHLLLPAFFVYSGLNTRMSLLVKPGVLVVAVVVIILAFAGKGLSVALAARLQGLDWRESGSLGALMNARGLMELVLLNIGLSAGLVTPQLYTVLAVMAIVTTFAASPVHHWFDRRPHRRAAAGQPHRAELITAPSPTNP